jgi:hypothetical protein
VVGGVLAAIDADGDGVISDGEQRSYAARVVGDLSLAIDGNAVRLRVVSAVFPKIEEMTEGLGEIRLDLEAEAPEGGGGARRLVFENRHRREIGAYLVNVLVPSDPAIRVRSQRRNSDQSVYELEYEQARPDSGALPPASWSTWRLWVGVNAVVLVTWGAIVLRKWRSARAGNAAGKPAG